jgi:hypothetical protein
MKGLAKDGVYSRQGKKIQGVFAALKRAAGWAKQRTGSTIAPPRMDHFLRSASGFSLARDAAFAPNIPVQNGQS